MIKFLTNSLILSFSAIFLNLVCLVYILNGTASVYKPVYKIDMSGSGLSDLIKSGHFLSKMSILAKLGVLEMSVMSTESSTKVDMLCSELIKIDKKCQF